MIFLKIFLADGSLTWGAGAGAEVAINIHLLVLVLDK